MAENLTNLNQGGGDFFGPDDELPIEIQNKCMDIAKINLFQNDGLDKDLNLEKDSEDLREPGQEYTFVSFMGPFDSLRAKHDKLQINIRGCCEEENIKLSLEKLQRETDKYDIYTFEMYTWIFIPPTLEYMQNVDKHEAQLNKIISAHRLRIEISKAIFETRKKLLQNADALSEENDPLDIEILKKSTDLIKNINTSAPSRVEIQDLSDEGIEKVPFNYREKLAEKEGQIQGQNFAIISIVGDDSLGRALKIKGIYETEDEAKIKMDILKEFDNTFEHYIVDCYRWLPVDVDPNDIENKVYTNDEFGDQLNDLYKEHHSQQVKAKQLVAKNPPKASVVLEVLEDDVERVRETDDDDN